MNTATTRRIAQTTVEDLHRLANQAEQKGVRILLTADGEHFATSSTSAVTLHRVSPEGCDCRGFLYWNRCSHHSLLLAELGLIPDVDPVVTDVVILDEQPVPCRECRGSGYVRVTTGSRLSDWTMTYCFACASHRAA